MSTEVPGVPEIVGGLLVAGGGGGGEAAGATSTTSLAASSEPPPEQAPKAVAKITIHVVIPSFLANVFIKISLVPIRCKSVVVRVTHLLASARKTSPQRCVPHVVRQRMY